MNPPLVFSRSVCFGYSTRVFSVRDAGTKGQTATRKTKDIQEVIHPSRISYFGRLKQEAFRLCRSHGTKMDLLDLWIVPSEDHDSLAKGLLDINHRWDEFVHNELLPNYVSWVERYAVENPNESADILRLAPTLDDVRKSTRFVFASFSLSDANIQSINLEEEVEGLWGQVLKEIAADIRDSHMDQSASFTQAARDVLRRITRKCKGLGFLHPRLEEVSNALDSLVATLPTAGKITGVDALAVRAVLDALLDPARFMKRGFGIHEDEQATLAFESDEPETGLETDRVRGEAEPASADEDPSSVPPVNTPRPEALAAATDFAGW